MRWTRAGNMALPHGGSITHQPCSCRQSKLKDTADVRAIFADLSLRNNYLQ